MNELTLTSIATIESCYRDRFAVPRQPLLVEQAWSFLRFHTNVQPELSLQGLEGYSHVWVIFGFHLNQVSRFHAKVHPPRLEGESMGLFATRTPHRPNPLGLSLVKIKKVTKEGLEVLGGDFADGTPVYDIKPYLPEVESISEAKGGWSSKVEKPRWKVEFGSPEIKQQIIDWGQSFPEINILSLITQTLEQDPRPLIYRDSSKNYKDTHAFRLFNGDIHFREKAGVFLICDFRLDDRKTL